MKTKETIWHIAYVIMAWILLGFMGSGYFWTGTLQRIFPVSIEIFFSCTLTAMISFHVGALWFKYFPKKKI